MTSYNPDTFATFVYDTLNNDSSITALVTGIYTYALQETNPPYVVISMDRIRPLNGAGLTAHEVEFSLATYSSEAGFSEVFEISEKLFTAMQGKQATISSFELVNTRFTDSDFERLKDGKGIKATLEFRSVIQQQ